LILNKTAKNKNDEFFNLYLFWVFLVLTGSYKDNSVKFDLQKSEEFSIPKVQTALHLPGFHEPDVRVKGSMEFENNTNVAPRGYLCLFDRNGLHSERNTA